MKLTKAILVGIAVLSTATSYGQRTAEFDEIRDFSEAQREQITHLGKGELMIGGDVRVEFKNVEEKYNGLHLTGTQSRQDLASYSTANSSALAGDPGVANQRYRVKLNLILDHKTEKTWARGKLKFKNDAGVGSVVVGDSFSTHHGYSGTNNAIELSEAFFGINLFTDGASRLDLEVGRDDGYHWFNSKVQFDSRMDGAFARYSNSFEGTGDLYVRAGAFVVNQLRDHYATVGEIGLMDIMDTGIYARYSVIDWTKKSIEDYSASTDARFEFTNSQFTVGYVANPAWINSYELHAYGAFLVNHAAKKNSLFGNGKKGAHAWYIGASVGDVKVKGDWFIDVNYQHVGAQAVADYDVHGIGFDNVAGAELYTDKHGNSNYKGYELNALYALSDNLSLAAGWESSRVATKSFDVDAQGNGISHTYKKFEVEAIYAF